MGTFSLKFHGHLIGLIQVEIGVKPPFYQIVMVNNCFLLLVVSKSMVLVNHGIREVEENEIKI